MLSVVTLVLALTLGAGRTGPAYVHGAEDDTGQTAETSVQASPSPSRSETKELTSGALNRTMPYLVYLPPGYDSDSAQRFPVLYMLHGLGGNYTDWRDGGLFATADRLISNGDVPPFIMVLPQGDSGYWVDHANGGPRWGTYVVRDIVTAVDGGYRTLPSREFRAVGGMSMGAHGAFQLALNFPDTFCAAGGHSLVLRTFETAFPYYGDRNYFNQHDPVNLSQKYPDRARRLKLWVDIGDKDPWEPAAESYHTLLESKRIAHNWHEWAGGHDGAYWSAHIEDYLRFYGSVFSQSLSGS
jgi:enterochelin esterase-like enzyme